MIQIPNTHNALPISVPVTCRYCPRVRVPRTPRSPFSDRCDLRGHTIYIYIFGCDFFLSSRPTIDYIFLVKVTREGRYRIGITSSEPSDKCVMTSLGRSTLSRSNGPIIDHMFFVKNYVKTSTSEASHF